MIILVSKSNLNQVRNIIYKEAKIPLQWSAVFVLVATAQIRVQGALNPLNPIRSIARSNRALKCAQLVSVDGGFFMFPGRGGAFPIPGGKGGLLIPGCLEIVHDSKEGKVVRAFEDLNPVDLESADLGKSVSSQAIDENPGVGLFVGSKYEIVDLRKP